MEENSELKMGIDRVCAGKRERKIAREQLKERRSSWVFIGNKCGLSILH